jgi:molybdopterin/thiamine biosynthesis adenylyltransferase/rhodanese-related sulfurtransferase
MSSSRYSPQVLLPEIGPEGQARIASASVLCIGAGGLGSPALLYLAAAGVGRITLLDPDRVEESNLQRQVLYSQTDLNKLKVDGAQKRLRELNPDLEIVAVPEAFSHQNARRWAQGCQLIVDGSDNFETRFLANEIASQMAIPLVYAAVEGFQGQVGIFWADRGACYRCLQPQFPQASVQNCELQGVLGSVVGTLGVLQAQLALQFLISGGDPAHPLYPEIGRLTVVDLSRSWGFSSLQVPKREGCLGCGGRHALHSTFLTASELKRKLESAESKPTLLDLRSTPIRNEHMISEAIPVSLETLQKGNWPEALHTLKKDDPLVVFCRQGVNSPRAVDLLEDQGFTHVQSLLGGLEAWMRLSDHKEHGP